MKVLLLSPAPRNESIRQFLMEQGHEVIVETGKIFAQPLKDEGIEFIISLGYAPIIKREVIEAFPQKIINVHNSYLPYGQGIYPIFWGFFNNTPQGVSIHYIDEGIDTGHVLVQKQIEIDGQETLKTAWNILEQEAVELFLKNITQIIRGEVIATPQANLGKGVYKNRDESEKMVSLLEQKWDTPVFEVIKMGEKFRKGQLDLNRVRIGK